VSQIIGNLLGNAAKYTPIGGEIQVAVNCERTGSEHAPGGIVSIVVSDNGTGIPPEVMPHVFNLFIQSHHTAGIGGGLGIGLAVVKRLVELHDGSIAVRSGGDGQGTQVTLRLPILRSQLGPYCPPTVSTEPSSLPVHVLLVDDNRDALDALSAVLQVAGHTVESRTTGPAALELLETSMPDIAIVDIGMPGMDGFAVARAIRSSGAYQHLYWWRSRGMHQSRMRHARWRQVSITTSPSHCRSTSSTQFCGRGCGSASCMSGFRVPVTG